MMCLVRRIRRRHLYFLPPPQQRQFPSRRWAKSTALARPLCQLSPQAKSHLRVACQACALLLSTPSARLCSFVHFQPFSFFTARIFSRHYPRQCTASSRKTPRLHRGLSMTPPQPILRMLSVTRDYFPATLLSCVLRA